MKLFYCLSCSARDSRRRPEAFSNLAGRGRAATAAVLLLTSALSACGGGGGGDSSSSSSGGGTTAPSTATFTIGGTVSGLTGTGLVLQNNAKDNLTVAANATSFTFATAIASGTAYSVTVATQPGSPAQTCTVSNGSGMASANVTNVAVSCTTAAAANVTVGGSVSGLAGTGLVLQNSGGDNLVVAANATTFTFPTSIAGSGAYAVTVSTQPSGPNQLCRVASGTGSASGANVTSVAVTCTTIGQFAYTANNSSGTLTSWSINSSTGALTLTSSPPLTVGALPAAVSLSPNGKFAFSATDQGKDIWAYTVDPTTGVLTAVPGSPFAVPFTVGHPFPDIAVDPTSHFLYLASLNDAVVAGFTIDQTSGALTGMAGSPYPADLGAGAIPAFSPNGNFLYVMDQNANKVSGYSITAVTGILVSIGNFDTGAKPTWISFTPNGNFAYVSNTTGDSVSEYSVDSGGVLHALGTVPVGDAPADLTIDATGTHLYVPNKAQTAGGDSISVFSIDPSTGLLTAVGTPVPTGLAPTLVNIEATGRFAYVSSAAGSDIYGYTIDATTGALTPMAAPFPSGQLPLFFIIDASGQFAYTANNGSSNVSAYTIDQNTGALTQISGSPYATGGSAPFVVSISPEAPGIRD